MLEKLLDIKNYRDPVRCLALEALLAALFIVLVIMHPLLDALVGSGMSGGMAALMVGVVGFVILFLMEKVWKLYGIPGLFGKK